MASFVGAFVDRRRVGAHGIPAGCSAGPGDGQGLERPRHRPVGCLSNYRQRTASNWATVVAMAGSQAPGGCANAVRLTGARVVIRVTAVPRVPIGVSMRRTATMVS